MPCVEGGIEEVLSLYEPLARVDVTGEAAVVLDDVDDLLRVRVRAEVTTNLSSLHEGALVAGHAWRQSPFSFSHFSPASVAL